MSEVKNKKYHVGFFNEIQTHDTKLTYGVYHVCDSQSGAIIAFATSKENSQTIVNALNNLSSTNNTSD